MECMFGHPKVQNFAFRTMLQLADLLFSAAVCSLSFLLCAAVLEMRMVSLTLAH